MNYAAQNTAPPPPVSLLSDSDRICGSLEEIRNRLVKIGDQLHGGRPSEVKDTKPQALNGSVRMHIDRAHREISSIFDELTRIENNL